MKATNALRPGTEPDFGLQTKGNASRPGAGPLQGGWEKFYASGKSDGGRPHLHTYGVDSEKFFQTSKLPYQPERPAKPPARAIGVPGQSWGIGGSLPCGTRTLVPKPAQGVANSSKRYLEPKPADDYVVEASLGRKKHVYDGEASHVNDRANRRSNVGYLEDELQRRGRVTEEMVSEKRTIHRMAPPGLKGYLGAEYANGYWMMDGVVLLAPPPSTPRPRRLQRPPRPALLCLASCALRSAELTPCPCTAQVPRTKMRMTKEDAQMQELQKAAERTVERLGKPISFKQKRLEEDLAEQVELVSTLQLDYDYISDDEDVPREKEKVLAD